MIKTSLKSSMLFVFLFFFILSAGAVTINVPSSLPSNVNWSFSVSLDSADSFEYSNVFLDNEKLLTVYPNGQTVKDPFNGQFVVASFVSDSDPATAEGLTLFVSVMGLSAGQHELKIETSQSGTLKDSQLSLIDFFVPLPESFSSRFDSVIDSITSVTDKIKEKNSEIEEKMLSVQTEFRQTQEYVNEINSKYEAQLNEFVQKQEAALSELEQKKAEIEQEELQKEQIALEEQALMEAEEKNSLQNRFAKGVSSGLAVLSNFSWLSVFLALAVVGVLVFFVLRSRSGASSKPESVLKDDLYDEEVEETIQEQKEKGKWASK